MHEPSLVKIKQEPPDPEDESVEESQDGTTTTDPQTSPEENQDEQNVASSSRPKSSVHVTVHRAEISATTVVEGNQELEELDVEVYDQTTYERGVFEQCNKALSISSQSNSFKNCVSNKSKKTADDLTRLIQSSDYVVTREPENETQPDRDELILELTRQQRLNKVVIKKEKPDAFNAQPQLKNLPRIPRLSQNKQGSEARPSLHERPPTVTKSSSSTSQVMQIKSEITSPQPSDSESGDDSDVSEYKPPGQSRPIKSNRTQNIDDESSGIEEDDLEDDIEYESDSDAKSARGDDETRRRKRKVEDDGDFKCYQARIKAFTRAKAQARLQNISDDGTEAKNLDETVQVEGELQAPKEIWDNLFEHQKIGVRWLWELHQLGSGGILGDEMGLGKTIQMIAFLAALRTSNIVNAHKGYDNLGPTILVCPATVMHQWLMEFRKWWPPFRVAILHNTGTFNGNKRDLVQVINKSRGVLIVSYPGVVIYQDYLHAYDWHYAVLDEGHKIRNPDAQVTLACKRFRTPHRIILSGSPVQNNLKELWSIFDFIFPGKLGTLPVFMEQFATPITQGGYANASDIQVQIAYKCSCVLRDTIKPFLLRRTKAEVNSRLKLPERSEQVLFCKLTEKQRKFYQAYLESPTVRDIKGGHCQIFVGLIELRKICNHPDLFDSTDCHDQLRQLRDNSKKKHPEFFSHDETFGHYRKSGKMMVVDALLKLWKSQGHKVLLFTQSRQMLKIFISYLNGREYKHMVMDGSTPIISRQTMIEEFNNNDEIFLFLLTTRVGGVGINLTGANRIIIYDPDWNPSTDIQARERAWRIGQKRHVMIYRLLTAGTIEEKIYHRQVFKLYLTNRILKDAKQKRFFKTNDLHELFTLGDNDKNIETKALFDEDLQINLDSINKSKKHSKKSKKKRRIHDENESTTNLISEEKLKAMREQAKRLSQMIAEKYGKESQQTSSAQVFPASGLVRIKIEPGCERQESLNTISDCTSTRVKIEPQSDVSRNPAEAEPSLELTAKSKKSSGKQRVDYLVKQDIYRPSGSTEEKRDKRYKRDDYILERLFKNSNIFGALKHDQIETDSTSDFKVIESEADKVARDAIRALRESRRMCLDSRYGVPNWTGRNGQVAAAPRLIPKNKSRAQFMLKAGQSSNEKSGSNSLLTAIKKRNQYNPVALARGAFSTPLDSDDEEETNKDFEGKAKGAGAEDMADKIRDYLLFKCARYGEAQTDDLLEFFKTNFNPDKTAIFKAILYKMCKFERRGDKGFWVLNTEFRDT